MYHESQAIFAEKEFQLMNNRIYIHQTDAKGPNEDSRRGSYGYDSGFRDNQSLRYETNDPDSNSYKQTMLLNNYSSIKTDVNTGAKSTQIRATSNFPSMRATIMNKNKNSS